MKYELQSQKLVFSLDDRGREVRWSAVGLPTRSPENANFWRLFLDNGIEREIAVFSRDQEGKVKQKENKLTVSYDRLADEYGRQYDVRLVIEISEADGAFCFESEIENLSSDVRVNEIDCPYAELAVIADEDTKHDILYLPYGLGQRIVNPCETVQAQNHTEYMAGDYDHVWRTYTYPHQFSMAWFGVESNGHFLYVGRHDEQFRTCSFSLGTAARMQQNELIFNVSQYPAVEKGEKIRMGRGYVALFHGSWKQGADFYKSWAKNYCPVAEIPDWVKNMTGWQRIILKHQFGRIFFTYRDMVKVFEDGQKYGLDTLLVFGWWKGCFDNGYPNYEPDEALGGAEELKKAIKQIQALGGHVILYNNGVLLDVTTNYYKKVGHKIEKRNIDGTSYREYYAFSDYGMMLRTFGYKSFSTACHATEEWKEKLIENAKIKLSFDPDSLFFDQLGGHLPRFCFNREHKHANRIDEDAKYKIENVRAIRAITPKDKCIGTENVVDVLAGYFDYAHGCEGAIYQPKYAFPSIFRYSFPEVVVTNRFAHDNRPFFRRELNYAFVNGLRFDISIYRGRMIGVAGLPDYADYLKKLLDLKEHYRDFFYGGRFIGDDTSIEKPLFITANLFESPDGRRLLVLWNEGDADRTIEAYGDVFLLKPNDFALKILAK